MEYSKDGKLLLSIILNGKPVIPMTMIITKEEFEFKLTV
jgi:hypothetical protein